MDIKSFFSFFFFLVLQINRATSKQDDFVFNGFRSSNLSRDGLASITSNGLLQMTNDTLHRKSHAFRPVPLRFKSVDGKPISFSTTFAFAIISDIVALSSNGMAFIISPSTNFSSALANQYLGLFNANNNGNSSNRVFAVELDTILNSEFHDIDNNHVGIDINGLYSVNSHTAGYYDDETRLFRRVMLMSGDPMQVWIDFDAESMQLNITLSLLRMPKPKRVLLSSTVDFGTLMPDFVNVGFSSSTGSIHTNHYVLGWSFAMNGVATPLDYAKLPPLPVTKSKGDAKVLWISLPVASCALVLLIVFATMFILRRRKKYAELLEDWELEYGPHRFLYKDLFKATNGFQFGFLFFNFGSV